MTFVDFGLSYLASWLANATGHFPLDVNEKSAEQVPTGNDSIVGDNPAPARVCRFNTFDVGRDLEGLLKTVREPVISLLIEDVPSTAYKLPSMVLESAVTREWYVFHRGRMSFEGSGGGLRNSRDILHQLKDAGASVGVWIMPQSVMDDLDNGYVLWPAVRHEGVPLLARADRDLSWAEIENNVEKLMKNE